MTDTNSSFYISPRFEEVVVSHIIMNMINIPFLNPPLILGIHGPAGEGKTLQCQLIFDRMGIKADILHGEQFENENAGIPVQMLKKQYMNAAKNNQKIQREHHNARANYGHVPHKKREISEKFTVIFINDLDIRIGRSDDLIQQTINTQLINAFLMELADNPSLIDGTPIGRVPIVATGNNFGTLYQPLIRDGRMEKFEWIPTLDERVKIVRRIFPEKSLSDADIRNLVREFSQLKQTTRYKNIQSTNMPISSYAMLRYYIYRKEVVKIIKKIGLESIVEYVLLERHVTDLRHPYFTIESVRQGAYELINNGTLINHLEVS